MALRSSKIKIRGRSKIRIKKGASLQVPSDGLLTLGFGDSSTASFHHSGFNLNLLKNSTVKCNGKASIGYNSALTVANGACFEIGDNTYISAKSHIYVMKSIKIGANCSISWNVTIMDSDLHYYKVDGEEREITKEVVIGDGVWIGNEAIIGAGSVVTKDVPVNCAFAGNSARLIRDNVEPICLNRV